MTVAYSYYSWTQMDSAYCLKNCQQCKFESPFCPAKCAVQSKYFECKSTCNEQTLGKCNVKSRCKDECSKRCKTLLPGMRCMIMFK